MKPYIFIFPLCFCHLLFAEVQDWRSTPPKPAATPSITLPQFSQFTLPNGLTVMVSSQRKLPIAVAKIVVLAGSAEDPAGKSGLSHLTFEMLDEGTKQLSALEFSDALAELGTTLSTNTHKDFGTLTLPLTKSNLSKGLALISSALLHPNFNEKEVERVKNNQISDIKALEADASYIALQTFWEKVYGKNHPYGHPTKGCITDVNKITVDEIRLFWKKHFGPKRTALILTGDITQAEAKQLAKTYLGAWKNPTPPVPSIPPPYSHASGNNFIDRPNSPQTVFIIGKPAIFAKNPQEPLYAILNEILGGSFGSRLNLKLREEKTWTYGVGSNVFTAKGIAPLIVKTSIQSNFTTEALEEIFSIFSQLQQQGITKEELEKAKNNLIKSSLGKFETIESIANQASLLFIYQFPLRYFQDYLHQIQKVQLKQVNQLAGRFLHKKGFTTVLVGEKQNMLGPTSTPAS